jgi:hypothetical protein
MLKDCILAVVAAVLIMLSTPAFADMTQPQSCLDFLSNVEVTNRSNYGSANFVWATGEGSTAVASTKEAAAFGGCVMSQYAFEIHDVNGIVVNVQRTGLFDMFWYATMGIPNG